MGSKKLKALVVRGSQPIYVADPQEVADLSDYMLREIVGSNNNHVVPSTQQEWAEYFDKGSRWTAQKGLTWALAEGGPIDTGEPKPGEINTVGYRCMKAFKDEGPEAEKYTIKMDGCHSCPIHCYSDLRASSLGGQRRLRDHGQHLRAELPFTNYMIKILGDNTSVEAGSEESLHLGTGHGLPPWTIWACGATTEQIYRDIAHCYATGLLRRCCRRRSTRKFPGRASRITTLAVGAPPAGEDRPERLGDRPIGHGPIRDRALNDMDWWNTARLHAHQRAWLAGAPLPRVLSARWGMLYNMVFNRDDMIHTCREPCRGCGPAHRVEKAIGAEIFGDERR